MILKNFWKVFHHSCYFKQVKTISANQDKKMGTSKYMSHKLEKLFWMVSNWWSFWFQLQKYASMARGPVGKRYMLFIYQILVYITPLVTLWCNKVEWVYETAILMWTKFFWPLALKKLIFWEFLFLRVNNRISTNPKFYSLSNCKRPTAVLKKRWYLQTAHFMFARCEGLVMNLSNI